MRHALKVKYFYLFIQYVVIYMSPLHVSLSTGYINSSLGSAGAPLKAPLCLLLPVTDKACHLIFLTWALSFQNPSESTE